MQWGKILLYQNILVFINYRKNNIHKNNNVLKKNNRKIEEK